MNLHRKLCTSAALMTLLAGCAHYAPPNVDPKTGYYATRTTLDKGAVLQKREGVSLAKYRFVYLDARSSIYTSRFEFFVRDALSRMGIKHVLNTEELRQLSRGIPTQADANEAQSGLSLERISRHYGDFLAIRFTSEASTDRRMVRVKIIDAASAEVLLEIAHNKFIWLEADSEAHYPVVNEIKRWVDRNRHI